MTLIRIDNVGALGVMRDIPPHELPPEAWSDAGNMRFYKKNAVRMLGHAQVFGTPSVVPGFIMNVPAPASSFWLYASKTAVYGYDAGVHTDITRAAGPYTAAEYREWQGCILGGIPILNNGVDLPQAWLTLSLGTKLTNLANFTSTLRAKILRNFGPFLVALNLNDNGTLLPQTIQWSHPADPGSVPASWDYTDPTRDAGRTHLTDVKGGNIQDAILLGSVLIIYKQSSTHYLRFVGGSAVLAPDLLLASSGILAARCACAIDSGKKHFVVTQDDVITHSGTRDTDNPLEEKDKDYLFADMDSTNYVNAFAFDNPAFREVWFAYPSSGQTFPDKALVLNYRTGQVTFRDFDGTSVDIGEYTDSTGTQWNNLTTTWDDQTIQWSTQARRRLIMGKPSATKIYGLDSGYAFGSLTPTAFLERTGLAIIGRDRQGQPKVDYNSTKLVKRIWPRIRGSATVRVQVGSQNHDEDPITWQSAKTFNATQKYLDFESVGVLNAVRFESTDNVAWQLEGYGLEVDVVANGVTGT